MNKNYYLLDFPGVNVDAGSKLGSWHPQLASEGTDGPPIHVPNQTLTLANRSL